MALWIECQPANQRIKLAQRNSLRKILWQKLKNGLRFYVKVQYQNILRAQTVEPEHLKPCRVRSSAEKDY